MNIGARSERVVQFRIEEGVRLWQFALWQFVNRVYDEKEWRVLVYLCNLLRCVRSETSQPKLNDWHRSPD